MSADELTPEMVRRVARLARLAIDDAHVARYAEQLGRIVGYVERLGELDLADVEPMTQPIEARNRLGADTPGPMLPRDALMGMAPASRDPFVVVPKVLGDSGGGA